MHVFPHRVFCDGVSAHDLFKIGGAYNAIFVLVSSQDVWHEYALEDADKVPKPLKNMVQLPAQPICLPELPRLRENTLYSDK
jgi:hypothetical protein